MSKDLINEVERNDLLAEMSDMYYKQGKTQSEIAKYYDTNRFKVAKMIQEALDEGIVEIRINYSTERNFELEKQLMELYPLNKALVVDTKYSSGIEIQSQIGKVGANYLTSLIKQNPTVGITWGKTLYSVISQLTKEERNAVNVVQLTGDSNMMNPLYDTRELVRMLAANFNGNYYYMNAPMYLRFSGVKETFYKEPAILNTMMQAKNMDVVISGIGGLSSLPLNNPAIYPYLTEEDLAAKENCIGSLFGYVINKEGEIADIDLNKKLVAVDQEDLMHARHRLVVASGRHKTEIITKTLEHHLFNELLTDSDTATRLIAKKK